jgi:3-oxoacyl-(acyl-carrier-protein) synthase
MAAQSPRKISPFFIPGSIINAAAGQVSILFGLKGPNLALVTACTTSTHSIGIAARTIQYGDADVMIAGGSEMAFTPLGLGAFGQPAPCRNMNLSARAGPGTATATDSSWRKARAPSCSRNTSMRERAVRTSTPSSPASA